MDSAGSADQTAESQIQTVKAPSALSITPASTVGDSTRAATRYVATTQSATSAVQPHAVGKYPPLANATAASPIAAPTPRAAWRRPSTVRWARSATEVVFAIASLARLAASVRE